MIIKLDKNYEVKTTLGTIRDIEKEFGKSFFEIANNVSKMTIDEQIKLLYVGTKKANPDLGEKTFGELCENHFGMGDFMEHLEKYFYSLQYPGLNEQEVQSRIQKKLEHAKAMKASRDLIG